MALAGKATSSPFNESRRFECTQVDLEVKDFRIKRSLRQFAGGATNEDVIAGFTGSAEYYKEHTS